MPARAQRGCLWNQLLLVDPKRILPTSVCSAARSTKEPHPRAQSETCALPAASWWHFCAATSPAQLSSDNIADMLMSRKLVFLTRHPPARFVCTFRIVLAKLRFESRWISRPLVRAANFILLHYRAMASLRPGVPLWTTMPKIAKISGRKVRREISPWE